MNHIVPTTGAASKHNIIIPPAPNKSPICNPLRTPCSKLIFSQNFLIHLIAIRTVGIIKNAIILAITKEATSVNLLNAVRTR